MQNLAAARANPRVRFWIAVPLTIAAILASFFLLPHLLPHGFYTTLFVPATFFAGLVWLLNAHANFLGGWRALSLARILVVSFGFAVAVLPLALVIAGALTFGRLRS